MIRRGPHLAALAIGVSLAAACSSLSGEDPGQAAPVPTFAATAPDDTGADDTTTDNTATDAGTDATGTDGTTDTTAPEPVDAESAEPAPAASADLTGELIVEILETIPHDTDAFTQGLELLDDGRLLESTGLRGESDRRLIDASTGVVERLVELDDEFFGEGLTVVDDQLVQLTWTEGVALVADLDDLGEVERYTYDGEGWGLCWTGDRFVMSDGSDTLTFRDRDFAVISEVAVTINGTPIERLNELECVGDRVWANVWQAQVIVGIDATSGDVVARLDASALQPPGLDDADDVLNGIAHDASDDTYWLTGKRWPVMHRVRIVPNPSAADQ